jgi:hypothetical protein
MINQSIYLSKDWINRQRMHPDCQNDHDQLIHGLAKTVNGMNTETLCSSASVSQTWITLSQMIDKKYDPLISQYIALRDHWNHCIGPKVMDQIHELRGLFDSDPNITDIILMSSYGASTNLIHRSDIDIGLIVNQMDEKSETRIGQVLVSNGYKMTKRVNGYKCYNKMVGIRFDSMDQKIETEIEIEIEIEVKVRDYEKSKQVIGLHDYLDNQCDVEQKRIFTYLKHRFLGLNEEFPKAYQHLKLLFYNTMMLKTYPQCKELFTSM